MHSSIITATLGDVDLQTYYSSLSYENYTNFVERKYHSLFNGEESRDNITCSNPYLCNLVIYMRMILEIHEVYTAPVVHIDSVRALLNRIGYDRRLNVKAGNLVEAIRAKLMNPADNSIMIHDLGNGRRVQLNLDHIKYCLTNMVRAILALTNNPHIDINVIPRMDKGEDVYPLLARPITLVRTTTKPNVAKQIKYTLNAAWDSFFSLFRDNYHTEFYVFFGLLYTDYLVNTYDVNLFADVLHTGVSAKEYITAWNKYFNGPRVWCSNFLKSCIMYINIAPTFPEGVRIDLDNMRKDVIDKSLVTKQSFFTVKELDEKTKEYRRTHEKTVEREAVLADIDKRIREQTAEHEERKRRGDAYRKRFDEIYNIIRSKYPDDPPYVTINMTHLYLKEQDEQSSTSQATACSEHVSSL